MTKEPKKQVLCIRLNERDKRLLDAEAKLRYLAPSKLAAIIIEQYYEKPKKK